MSVRLAALTATMYLVTQASGCGSAPSPRPPDVPGQVSSRKLVGTGVILRVRHEDGKTRDHAYDTQQPGCSVSARWPDCVKGARP